MEIFDPDPGLPDIIRQILSHALCQRCDQDLIVAFHLLVDLSDEIVDLALHRTDADLRIQKAGGTDDLLCPKQLMLCLIYGWRGGYKHHLADVAFKFLKI